MSHNACVCACLDGAPAQGQGQGQVDIEIYGEAPDKLTYTEQANKRTKCKRLTWYCDALLLTIS